MATEEIQLPADGLRFKDLVQFTNLPPEEFLAACPHPFLLQVPVEQPTGRPGIKGTQRLKALTTKMLQDMENNADPTLIVEPVDIMSLVRSRSGKAAQEVIVHMISPRVDGAKVVIVGRDDDADVKIDTPTVTQRHAELSQIGPDVWQVKDLGSMNGTFVDGKRSPTNAYTIVRDRGDLRFGTYQAVFLSSRTLYKLIQRLKGEAK